MKHNKYKKVFINPQVEHIKRSFKDFLKWQMGYYSKKSLYPRRPSDFQYPNLFKKLEVDSPLVTWVNHCTFFIKIDGIGILTDPIWSQRCSPINFIGPKRTHPVPFSLEQIPKTDIVLISHDHYDHFDKKTVKFLVKSQPNIVWVVPLGLKKRLINMGANRIIEMDWWERSVCVVNNKKIYFNCVPSQHFSGRGVFDKNSTLWSGFVVEVCGGKEPAKSVYFVGDTGYNNYDFKEIGKRFTNIDLSLIPIGTYIPSEFMDPVHINPDKAVMIHKEVNSKLSVGMHWKTFKLSNEGINQPPYDLYCALSKNHISPEMFRVLNIGQTINW